jgi:hypothetical protein
MTLSKTDQITALALEILEDAEMSRTSVESMVLKTSRLARLVDDEETLQWLWHERHGYDDNTNTELSLKYLTITSRWIDINAKTAYFAGIVVHESLIQAQQEQLEVVKRFVPSGDWAAAHFQNQQDKARAITSTIMTSQRIVFAVRAQIQEVATRIYHESIFSHQAGTIFTQYQSEVDALLAVTAKTAFTRLPQAFQRLGAGDPEAISHALATCRRVIDSFTDAVFPPQAEPARIGDQEIKVGAREIRNRLRAYVYQHIGQGSRYERDSIGGSARFMTAFLPVSMRMSVLEKRAHLCFILTCCLAKSSLYPEGRGTAALRKP